MKILLTVLLINVSLFVAAQSSNPYNTLYAEAGGNGLWGSVNYERQLTKTPKWAVRVGVGFYTEDQFYLTLPVGVNYLIALKNKHSFIDLGVGGTWALGHKGGFFTNNEVYNENSFLNIVPSIGYRRHTDNGLMWRASITPIINRYALNPFVGFSLGKRF